MEHFTHIYLLDNRKNPSENIINVNQLMSETDDCLDELFKGIELEADYELVAKIMEDLPNLPGF